MKIYDCFSYWDEDLLLDLRLNILNNHVDYFVIIEGNNITSIRNGFIDPESEDINIIDLKSKTLIPGLIDFHVHMESESGGQERYINRFQDNEADVAFRSTVVARKTLMAGFTTVRGSLFLYNLSKIPITVAILPLPI